MNISGHSLICPPKLRKKKENSLGKLPSAAPCMLSGRVLAWPLPEHLPGARLQGRGLPPYGLDTSIGKPTSKCIYPPGNDHRSHQTGSWEIIDSKLWFLMGCDVNSQEGTSWWLNQQIWKICDGQIGSWNPNFRGEHKNMWNHHPG